MLTRPKLIVPFQIGRPADFAFAGVFGFLWVGFLRGMDFCGYSMDFWLIVVQALSLRCFTLTVRPRVVFVSSAPRALPLLLLRRLCVMETPAGIFS